MSALVYTYTTASYLSTVLPQGPLEPYSKDHLRTISKLLQPPQLALLSPFGTEVALYISHTHRFNYKPLPDDPIAFSVIIDINPENNFLEPEFNLRITTTECSKYFLRWDSLPCVIPPVLYKALISRSYIYSYNLIHLISELELWWGQLLLRQNTLTQHIRQTHRLPYLPNTLHSPILHPDNPLSSTDPLEETDNQ